jgi:hypothetical protein
MRFLGVSGVWEIFIPNVGEGALYKFEILDAQGQVKLMTDPFGTFFEQAPKNAAIVWNNKKGGWTDDRWIERRSKQNALRAPMSIYEVHLGSWKKRSSFESFSYRELAAPLIDYVKSMAFTHVVFLPVAEPAFSRAGATKSPDFTRHPVVTGLRTTLHSSLMLSTKPELASLSIGFPPTSPAMLGASHAMTGPPCLSMRTRGREHTKTGAH